MWKGSGIPSICLLTALMASTGARRAGAGAEPAWAWEFARAVERAVQAGDSSYVESRLDRDALFLRATEGLGGSASDRSRFRGALQEHLPFGRRIVATIAAGGSYLCLRIRAVEGRTFVLFRLASPDTLNYHDYEVARGGDGPVVVRDIYIYYAGEHLSEGLRRGYLQSLAVGGASTPPGGDAALRGVLRMYALYRSGRPEEALAAWSQIPIVVREEKTLHLQRVRIAAEVGGAAYAEALRDFESAHPGDPSLDLISIDGLLLAGRHDAALQRVERLQRSLGGDPYLHLVRARILLAAGEPGRAERFAARAVRQDATLADAYWMLVRLTLEAGRFRRTAAYLSEIDERFGIAAIPPGHLPRYQDFLASRHGDRWAELGGEESPPRC